MSSVALAPSSLVGQRFHARRDKLTRREATGPAQSSGTKILLGEEVISKNRR